MIAMMMRDQQQVRFPAGALDCREDRRFLGGVDQQGAAALVVMDQHAEIVAPAHELVDAYGHVFLLFAAGTIGRATPAVTSAFLKARCFAATVISNELGHRRPALVLRLAARSARRTGDRHGAVGGMGQAAQRAPGRHGLCAALARPFRHRCRARLRVHAGHARGGELAAWGALVDRAGVRRGIAAARFDYRPVPAGASAGAFGKSARDAQGDLARAGAGRAAGHRRAQPARRLGALRAHAVRHRAAVFARPADRTFARDQFHAERLERGAVLPAVEAALDDALPPIARTQRPAAVADLLRRGHRRGAETSLPGHPGRPARLAARVRAGAVAARRDADARDIGQP